MRRRRKTPHPSWGKFFGLMSRAVSHHMRCHPEIRSQGEMDIVLRFGLWGCGIRGGFLSIDKPAIASSVMWVRSRWRRSTSRLREAAGAPTTDGLYARDLALFFF